MFTHGGSGGDITALSLADHLREIEGNHGLTLKGVCRVKRPDGPYRDRASANADSQRRNAGAVWYRQPVGELQFLVLLTCNLCNPQRSEPTEPYCV